MHTSEDIFGLRIFRYCPLQRVAIAILPDLWGGGQDAGVFSFRHVCLF